MGASPSTTVSPSTDLPPSSPGWRRFFHGVVLAGCAVVGLEGGLQQVAELADRADGLSAGLAGDRRSMVRPFRDVEGECPAIRAAASRFAKFQGAPRGRCRLVSHMLRSLRTDSQTDSARITCIRRWSTSDSGMARCVDGMSVPHRLAPPWGAVCPRCSPRPRDPRDDS
jgi:hypothetical protein